MSNKLIINDFEQDICFYLLPKQQSDYLFLEIPSVVIESVSDWILNKSLLTVYLIIGYSKYTFTGAFVDKCKIYKNRYNIEVRELFIRYNMMSNNYKKRT
jgi:hypothetical protein